MLDDHLLEYIHIQKNQLRAIRRLKKLVPSDPLLHQGEIRVLLRIELYESYLENPHKKYKKRINIRRTFNQVFYMVKFVYFFKSLLKRKKKHEKTSREDRVASNRA